MSDEIQWTDPDKYDWTQYKTVGQEDTDAQRALVRLQSARSRIQQAIKKLKRHGDFSDDEAKRIARAVAYMWRVEEEVLRELAKRVEDGPLKEEIIALEQELQKVRNRILPLGIVREGRGGR